MNGVNSSRANGHRANDEQNDTLESQEDPRKMGSWGRRMSKRYDLENDFRVERADRQRDAVIYDGVVEKAGKTDQSSMGTTTAVAGVRRDGGHTQWQIQRRKSMLSSVRLPKFRTSQEEGQKAMVMVPTSRPNDEVRLAHGTGARLPHRPSRFIEHTTITEEAPRELTKVILPPSATQAQLSEPTDTFRALMLGEKKSSYKSKVRPSPSAVLLKFNLKKLLPDPSKKLAPKESSNHCLKLPPQQSKVVGGTALAPPAIESPTSVRVRGVPFDMLTPQARPLRSPVPAKALPPRSIPPRTASKNFTAVPPKPLRGFLLAEIPQKLRKRIFALVIVANHEILVCTCGFCALTSGCKQPALTQVSRQFRHEALPIYYGENKFMLRGTYSWHNNSKAPVWLRVMSQPTRDLIRHIEVCTADIASVVCMMALMGFRMSHRLPKKQRLNLGMALENEKLWMTFTATCPPAEEVEEEMMVNTLSKKPMRSIELPTIRKVSSIRLWDCDGHIVESWDIDTPRDPEARKSLDLISEVGDASSSCSSFRTVGTSVLDLSAIKEEVLVRGDVARTKRICTKHQDSEQAGANEISRLSQDIDDFLEDLDSFGDLPYERRSDTAEQRAEERPKQRYSVGGDIVRASSGSFA